MRLLRVVAGELWLAGVFCRRVCAGGEDILLSERDGGGHGRIMAVRLREEKRARAGSRNSI